MIAGLTPRLARPRALGIVVPTYNRSSDLRRSLDSLVAQRCSPDDFEVVVADDGSAEPAVSLIAEYADRLNLRYVYQHDAGFRAAAARNAGALLLNAPVLAFLDHGSIATPEYVNRVLALHAADGPGRVMLGYEYGYNPWQPCPELLPLLEAFPAAEAITRARPDRIRDVRHADFGLPDDPVDPDPPDGGIIGLSGLAAPWMLHWAGNLSLRTADFWAVGGFDEDFRTWGVEDLELGYRLWQAGVSFLCSRGAWSVETPRDRDSASNVKATFPGIAEFWRKHPDPAGELLWGVCGTWRGVDTSVEQEMRSLRDWQERSRDIAVLPELDLAGIRPSTRTIAVMGSGGQLPASWPQQGLVCTAIDFDRELAQAAAGAHGCHAIGIKTPFANDQFDQVIITSRMRGLTNFVFDLVLEEAQRIGAEVSLTFGPRPRRPGEPEQAGHLPSELETT